MQEPSVFTKIINGEILSHKVYEDERVIAFLDINPLTPGHTLVVPKAQIDNLWDLDDELYTYVMEIVKKVAARQQEVLGPKRVGMSLEGFAVPHAHVHVFPLYEGLETTVVKHVNRGPQQLDNEALADMAKKLYFS